MYFLSFLPISHNPQVNTRHKQRNYIWSLFYTASAPAASVVAGVDHHRDQEYEAADHKEDNHADQVDVHGGNEKPSILCSAEGISTLANQ